MTNKEIKQELRMAMNGVASAHMREAGLNYHVNFGIEMPRLQEIASRCGHNASLARELWNENVRESKILACMIMPVEAFSAIECDLWVDQIANIEIAQIACMFLFSRLPYAVSAAFVWMASDRPLRQVCGFTLIARLLTIGVELSESAKAELIDQCDANVNSDSYAVVVSARRARDKVLCSD